MLSRDDIVIPDGCSSNNPRWPVSHLRRASGGTNCPMMRLRVRRGLKASGFRPSILTASFKLTNKNQQAPRIKRAHPSYFAARSARSVALKLIHTLHADTTVGSNVELDHPCLAAQTHPSTEASAVVLEARSYDVTRAMYYVLPLHHAAIHVWRP